MSAVGASGPGERGALGGSAVDESAAAVIALATASGTTVAVAESLTAGLVCARLADVPGASAVLRGGVVAYATDLKASLLDVDPDLLDARGAVDQDVALAMAAGVRHRLGADVGVATTGAAGPDPADGAPPGTVYVAVVTAAAARVERLHLAGGRRDVRAGTTDAAIVLLLELLSRVAR